jgi:hypothetical protein
MISMGRIWVKSKLHGISSPSNMSNVSRLVFFPKEASSIEKNKSKCSSMFAPLAAGSKWLEEERDSGF